MSRNPIKWMKDKLSKKKKGPEPKPEPDHKITMSDPDALPSASELEAKEAKERMDKANAEHRWMDVSSGGSIIEYSEEWQRILLLAVNGIGTMLKLSGTFENATTSTDEQSPVKAEHNADGTTRYIAVSSAGILMGGIDTQVKRLEAVKAHLDKYPPKPLKDGDKVHTVPPEFVPMLDIMANKLMFAVEDGLISNIISVRKELVAGMESCGFEFKTKRYPLVGEKYEFTKELKFVGAVKKV